MAATWSRIRLCSHNGAPVVAGAWGGARGCIQRSKVSMMRMRPPQQGRGEGRVAGQGRRSCSAQPMPQTVHGLGVLEPQRVGIPTLASIRLMVRKLCQEAV
jgi:hypothetical protein